MKDDEIVLKRTLLIRSGIRSRLMDFSMRLKAEMMTEMKESMKEVKAAIGNVIDDPNNKDSKEMFMVLSSLPSILISPVKTHHMSRAICGGEDTMTGKVLSMVSLLCICVGSGQLYRLCRWVRIGRKGKRMMTKII